MNYNKFLKTKEFIVSDIKREIRLAQATNNPERKKYLEKAKVNPGGGNFLAALGLLCYTEFLGKLKYNIKNERGKDKARENFNSFFDDLGSRYKRFRAKGVKVYDIFAVEWLMNIT